MIVGGSGGARVAGRQQQVHPVDYVAEVSQKLVDAAHRGDLAAAVDCLCNPVVDVNFTGAVRFKGRLAELVTREEAPSHVRFDCEEFITDVSPLFLAAHTGNLPLLRKLLRGKSCLFSSWVASFSLFTYFPCPRPRKIPC